MELETKRLILRKWEIKDAKDLYEYAKDPLVGPIAGWPVHKDIKDSESIIKTVLSKDETYAVCLKENNKTIGSVGLMRKGDSNLAIGETEAEIGFWLGVPFWGKGIIPEAVNKLVSHAFNDLKITTLWCGYFDKNEKSKRCQEKCGFIYHHTNKDIFWPLMNDIRTEHVTVLTKNEWENSLLNVITDKDDKVAYKKTKSIIAESQDSKEYYKYLDDFALLLTHEKSYVRTRAFLLIISQAKWDKDNKIEKIIPSLLPLLHDCKPTVLRQCLNAAKELAIYKPNLFDRIKEEVKSIDLTRYNESMSPLIAKDIENIINL